ncbi:MAG: rod shape-determining protein [Oscillospiraceae bacterium]
MASLDIGIDLGTANIIITMINKGIVLNEPSVVAFNKKTNSVVAVGKDAYEMLGRTPEYIVAIRPLSEGVISDHNMTEEMINAFILKVCGKQLLKPRIVLCVPSLITDVESRAVVEAARHAGARKVFLLQEPIAALIGAGVDIAEASGHIVVDIGGGTTDVAVISLNGIVKSTSLKIAGNKIDQAIIKYITNRFKVLIGEKTAELLKKSVTDYFEPSAELFTLAKGRNLLNGLPEKIQISDLDVYNAIVEPVYEIIHALKSVLEVTPPELVGDIYSNGVLLTGGGALLNGLDKIISKETGIKCIVADDPIACVARGTGLAFNMLDKLLDGFQSISAYN